MSFYIVPIVGAGTRASPRAPKYVTTFGIAWSMVDHADTAIVWANASAAQDATIAANADAIVVPALDNNVAVAATQTAVEALNIPAQWITAAMTYRQVLRVVIGMAQLIQRMQGFGVNPVIAGNLDKTMSQFTATITNTLAAAVDSLGLDRSNILDTTTLRAALFDIGNQFSAGRVVSLGDL